jgi:uncharacterized protein YecE (DUF72 family)
VSIMAQWKIGCSGYHYAEWKGLFYPQGLAKNKWFSFYCEHFNTIELNNTFYRFPRVEVLKNWFEKSPADFSFSVKAPRVITHFKKLKEAQRYLSDFYNAVREGLREKAGVVLFQFPSDFHFDHDRLGRITGLLDPSFTNVVEFRHSSWWNETAFSALKDHGISFSGMSHPSLPDRVIKTTDTIYYRFHGVPHLYISTYEVQQLEKVARAIQQLEGTNSVFLYFNNTTEGAAITNAKQLQEIAELVH